MPGHDIAIACLGPLTPREAEAVLWTAEGKTAWEAGTILGVTTGTLNAHIANAAAKLCASNRAHLVARAFALGILAPANGPTSGPTADDRTSKI
jgi:DNA-binding CsgD family transcriptional regulator